MKFKLSRKSIFILLVIALLVSALPGVAFAKSDRVRVTVTNKSDKVFSLWLTGPEYIYMTVDADSADIFTPLRGVYNYTMYSCGVYAYGEFDFTTQKKMIIPACGSAAPQKTGGDTIDVSETVKLVKVKMDNNVTNSNMVIVLTGPGTYVFSLKANEVKSYTIPRGEYNVTYYACGKSGTRMFVARANKVLELSCPK